MKTTTKGIILALFGATCWGISGCVGQYLFTREHMSTPWLVPIRLGAAGIVLTTYYLIRNRQQTLSVWATREQRRDLVIYGLLGVSCCQFFYFLTIQLSTAGFATIAQDMSPVMILVLVCAAEHRRPRPLEIASIILAILGLFFLVTHANLAELAVSPAALAAGLISAVCVVIYTLVPRKLQESYPTPMLQGWAFLMGGAAFAFLFRPWEMGYTPTPTGLLGIAAVVVIGNILAFSCYMTGVHLVGPGRASLCSFAEPACAALISTTFMGSPFTGWDAAGFICIFVMLVLLFWDSVHV